MTYDVELADRLREVLQGEPDVSEKRMFGGMAFLIAGHLAVSASSHGGLLLRVDPARTEAYVDEPRVARFVMRGREMDGWLRVDGSVVADDDALRRWARIGVDYARTLSPR